MVKLHEKAKELGIKATELVKMLNDQGLSINSVNQNLSEEEEVLASQLVQSVQMPDSENFDKQIKESKGEFTLMIEIDKKNHTLILSKKFDSLVEVVTKSTFPNNAQMFMEAEYLIGKIELGEYDKFN